MIIISKNTGNNTKMTDKKFEMKSNSYCLVCRKKNKEKKIRGLASVNKTESQKSLCTVCGSRKLTFLKETSDLQVPVIKIYS